MHVADALVSPPVAIVAGIISASLIVVASKKVSKAGDERIIPLMGVMGAFIFAAQMINFSIPGTGSSGHIVGGILLSVLLGPWAGFLTLCSVLIIQCLIFADGGLMALGCNILNMAVFSCLVGYPLIYKPISGKNVEKWRIMAAAVVSCVVSLELGALAVTAETELSGITLLPTGKFLSFMLPIHLVIGVCEGVATGLLLEFIKLYKPDMLKSGDTGMYPQSGYKNKKFRNVLILFAVAALLLGLSFTWIASSAPDGLEWSISKVAGEGILTQSIVSPTAIMPDYDSTLSGIVGGIIVLLMIWGMSAILFRRKMKKSVVKVHREK